jgi:hypothetical protein
VVGGDDERAFAHKIVFHTRVMRMKPKHIENLWQQQGDKRDYPYQYESCDEDFPCHDSPFMSISVCGGAIGAIGTAN